MSFADVVLWGVILDKMGIRFTGIMSSGLMFAGALINGMPLLRILEEHSCLV